MLTRICPHALVAALIVGGCYKWDKEWPAVPDTLSADLPAAGDGPAADLEPDQRPIDGLPSPDKPFTVPGVWKLVPNGTFTMGSANKAGICYQSVEAQHQVTLSKSFRMMDAEVTQIEFKTVMGYNDSTFSACGNCPVDSVSWHMAAAYCNELSRRTGKMECYACTGSGPTVQCDQQPQLLGNKIYDCTGYRLPTEAEWEHAYRAGTTTDFYSGDMTSTLTAECQACKVDPALTSIAWYCDGQNSATHPVRSRQKNKNGLFDMAGNVMEWCNDWFNNAALTDAKDPGGPATGDRRVRRGGGYESPPQYLRASRREREYPHVSDDSQGFRCVISP